MLALEGADATDDDTGQPLVIGPNKWLSSPAGSTIKYVEHSGAAIEAGRNDLQDLEEHMSQYAAEFLKKQPGLGAPTATGRALDSAEAISPLQAMGTDFKAAIELLLEYTCLWMNKEPEDTDCDIVFDIEVDEATGSDNDTNVLDKARTRRDISREGFLTELKRRDILDEAFDIEDDAEKLKEEADTALSMFGQPMPGEEDILGEEGEEEEDEEGEGDNKPARRPGSPPVEE